MIVTSSGNSIVAQCHGPQTAKLSSRKEHVGCKFMPRPTLHLSQYHPRENALADLSGGGGWSKGPE